MDFKVPLLILQAVHYLHRQGFGSLRIHPGMNASGTAWRITIFNAFENPQSDSGEWFDPEPDDEANCLRYSSAGWYEFAETEVDDDTAVEKIALLILAHLPAPRATGSDTRYVRWYDSLMEHVRSMADLPVAYADYMDHDRGWEIGWGSGRRHPAPPVD